jgi:hypothetical protein
MARDPIFRPRPKGSGEDFSLNPGEKRPFIVNIYDRDMQREMDLETWAVSPRKAEANAWFRLMEMEDFTGSVGVFRARYGERYRIYLLSGPPGRAR